MTYVYSHHARNRMRLYGITREEIRDCAENPGWHEVEPVDRGVYHHTWVNALQKVWKRRAGKYLYVLYTDEGDKRVIIATGPRNETTKE